MVESTTSRVALISLKPKYAEAILSGSKTCEFRRVAFAQEVKHVVFYATLPVGQVVGVARVAGIREDTPDQLWAEFEGVGGISEDEFTSYYVGAEKGIAIMLESVLRLPEALCLDSLGDSIRAPQSFLYLGDGHLEALAPWLSLLEACIE